MSVEFVVTAEQRSDMGKGASRRLRRDGKVPAILYGGDKDPVNLLLEHRAIKKSLEQEAFFSSILTLKLGKTKQKVILRDMQRHPFKSIIMHMDFQRVSEKDKIKMQVPLHFINEESCIGVKMEGGTISHNLSSIEIICAAKDLPEYIEIDLEEIHLGQTLHLTDIVVPKGVEIAELIHGAGHDQPVVSVRSRAAEEVEIEAEEEAEADADAEAETDEEPTVDEE